MSNKIVGLIPAAGKGSRLAPFPCPKELFPVGYQDYKVNGVMTKRPKVVSQYLLEHMVEAGARQVMFIVSEGKGDIMKYFGDGHQFSADIVYLFQEVQDGMPGALNLARNWIEESTVVFGMPDTIIEPENAFVQLREYHDINENDLTLGLFRTNTPAKFGMVSLDDQGAVNYTIDKPLSSDLEYMWGCACWSPAFTKLIDEYLVKNTYEGNELVLGDVFNLAIDKKMKVMGYPFKNGQYLDIGTSDELNIALKKFHL